jgi:hypothetical protein
MDVHVEPGQSAILSKKITFYCNTHKKTLKYHGGHNDEGAAAILWTVDFPEPDKYEDPIDAKFGVILDFLYCPDSKVVDHYDPSNCTQMWSVEVSNK